MSLTIVSLVLVGIGLIFFIAAFKRLRKKKLFSACGHGTMAIVFLTIGVLMISFAMNFYTYDRLSLERHVADIRFEQIGHRKFKATLTLPDKTSKDYELIGDQWLLEAKIIKWNSKANLFGMDSRYRLTRLNVRYNNIAEEREPHSRTIYSLRDDKNPGFIEKYKNWMPWLDSKFYESVGKDMIDKAHYRINITQSGLVPYAINDEAKSSGKKWDEKPK